MKKCKKSLFTDSMQKMRKKMQKRKLRPNLNIKAVKKSIITTRKLSW